VMLEFTLYRDARGGNSERIFIEPTAVAMVRETELQPPDAFWQPVAVITTVYGESFIVNDHARDAGARIRVGKLQASLTAAPKVPAAAESHFPLGQ
jgi:hypothetical protein